MGDCQIPEKEGGDKMSKKDFLILSLVILIFLLVFLLFIVLIWKENHLTQTHWIRWNHIYGNTQHDVLSVPFILYEVSFTKYILS